MAIGNSTNTKIRKKSKPDVIYCWELQKHKDGFSPVNSLLQIQIHAHLGNFNYCIWLLVLQWSIKSNDAGLYGTVTFIHLYADLAMSF